MTDKAKPIQVAGVSTRLWLEFAGEAKKQGKKTGVAVQEAIKLWLEKK